MAKWTDLADWVGPTPNHNTGSVECRGVVIHIAEGSYDGTIAWQKNPDADVSSHFIAAKDGRACQMVDTADTAWTQKAGNGHWLSIENEGHVPDKLSSNQVEFAAQILARAHTVYGVPLQVATSPDGRGLGHHSMGSHPGYADDWGHSQCPGSNIINQKPAIVARAKEIVEGDVALTDAEIEKIASKTLTLDGVVDNPTWRSDHSTNAKIQLSSAVEIAMEVGHEASTKADQALAALARIEALLAGGAPLPPPGGETSATFTGTVEFKPATPA